MPQRRPREDYGEAQGSARDAFASPLRHLLPGIITGCVSLSVYLATLAPTVLADDSGELATAAYLLGIAHPTGYPLYLLLGKGFTFIPLSGIAVRVGMVSVLSGALAVAIISSLSARISDSFAAGLAAGVVAAFSGPMWSQSTQVEVYAFGALLLALSIAAFARWDETRRVREVVWLAFLVGLALSHHRTSAFLTLPLLGTAFAIQRPPLRVAVRAILVGLSPFLAYVYVPMRAAAHPAVMWSGVDTWSGFLKYMAASTYKSYVFARPAAEALAVAREVGQTAVSELTLGGTAIAAVGLVSLLRRRATIGLPLLVGSVCLVVWTLGYDVGDYTAFLVPVVLFAGICAGEGLRTVLAALRSILRAPRRETGGRSFETALAVAVILVLVAGLLLKNWSESGHRGYWRDYDRERALLAQLPPGAILVTNLDYGLFLPMYVQLVDSFRQDVVVVNTTGSYAPWTEDELTRVAVASAQEAWPGPARPDHELQIYDALPFATYFGEMTRWARPIYCHAYMEHPPGYEAATALWSDLFLISESSSEPVQVLCDSAPVVGFERGVSLVGAEVHPSTVGPRDVFRIVLQWRCGQALSQAPFVLVSLAHEDESGQLVQPTGMLVRYGTWLAGGAAPIAPTEPGLVYRQEIVGMAPTGAPDGKWVVRIGVSDEIGAPIDVHEVCSFVVSAP